MIAPFDEKSEADKTHRSLREIRLLVFADANP